MIQQPVEEIGRRAAEILFDQLLDDRKAGLAVSSKRNLQIKMQTRLIRRSSCGCIPAIS